MVHPFFVSVIDINHNVKETTVEISVRIFTDDLEKTLRKKTTGTIDLTNPKDKAFVEKQINAYISQKLQLKINGQPAGMHFLGYEQQQESTWSYFEVKNIRVVKNLGVFCSLLHDFETNQVNIFHVKANGAEKSFKLDYPDTATVFNF
ncbi:MAG: hypothetical protein NVSMB63_03630 [Sediminibacterium sp.]